MEIGRAAAKIIRKKGFDATSMNDIAKAVGLTKAGLYYYTSSKQELLYKISSFAMDKVEEEVVKPCLEIAEMKKRLRLIINRQIQISVETGGEFTILTNEVNCLLPTHRREIIGRKRDYLNVVRDTLKELKVSGELRNLDITVAALNLFATILGMARWYRHDGKYSPERISEEVTDFILGGLLLKP
ncbi:TetR/AcrR family transcriptional regulator [Candidatus Hydrogenedentota bacterium]